MDYSTAFRLTRLKKTLHPGSVSIDSILKNLRIMRGWNRASRIQVVETLLSEGFNDTATVKQVQLETRHGLDKCVCVYPKCDETRRRLCSPSLSLHCLSPRDLSLAGDVALTQTQTTGGPLTSVECRAYLRCMSMSSWMCVCVYV